MFKLLFTLLSMLIRIALFLGVVFVGYKGFKDYENLSKTFKQYKKYLILGIPLLLGVLLLFTCIYTVDQTEYAVIETFGKPDTDIIGSGLKFKLPYPIQSVTKLSKETYSTTFGYKEKEDGELKLYEHETKMITGDENIILADLEIQWKIVDPISFLYNTDSPKDILFNATSASLKGVVGSSMVDDVLTDGRAKIISDIREDLVKLVSNYNLGISIINVNLQDVDLPTDAVDNAFKAVTDAREERLTKVNNAQKYKNEKLNEVTGEKDAILSKAEATKVSTIEKAKGDTARFEALYNEYMRDKGITKQRLITDTLNSILKDVQLYIIEDSSGTVKYLPIQTIGGGSQ